MIARRGALPTQRAGRKRLRPKLRRQTLRKRPRPKLKRAARRKAQPAKLERALEMREDPHTDHEEPSPKFASGRFKTKSPWRVAGCLLALRRQIDSLAPERDRKSDGTIGDAVHATRTSDHNPWVMDGGMGVVTAMDITHDPARGCDAGKLAEALRQVRDPRVKYVIWNRQIMSSSIAPWTWRPYAGSNAHTKHVHISVRPEKASFDSEEVWQGLDVQSSGRGKSVASHGDW